MSTVPPEDDPSWNAWKPDFESYDVVVQNTTDIQTKGKWPREIELAFEKYMINGGRMLTHHAANHGFKDWVEYNRMIGLSWRSKDYGSALTVAANGAIVPIPPGSGADTRHDYRGDALIHRLAEEDGLPESMRCAAFETVHDRAVRWLAGVTQTPPVPADFPTRDSTSVRAP